jgi:hypothetical protein
VGYNLGNQSYKGLPLLLRRHLGLEIEDRLIRQYLPTEKKGQYLQVNIYGWAKNRAQGSGGSSRLLKNMICPSQLLRRFRAALR